MESYVSYKLGKSTFDDFLTGKNKEKNSLESLITAFNEGDRSTRVDAMLKDLGTYQTQIDQTESNEWVLAQLRGHIQGLPLAQRYNQLSINDAGLVSQGGLDGSRGLRGGQDYLSSSALSGGALPSAQMSIVNSQNNLGIQNPFNYDQRSGITGFG